MIRFLFREGVRWGVDIRGCAWACMWAQPLNLPQRHTEPFLLSRLRNAAEVSPPVFKESLSLVLFQNTARSTTTRCVAQWHKHILFFIFAGLLFFGASGLNNRTHKSFRSLCSIELFVSAPAAQGGMPTHSKKVHWEKVMLGDTNIVYSIFGVHNQHSPHPWSVFSSHLPPWQGSTDRHDLTIQEAFTWSGV